MDDEPLFFDSASELERLRHENLELRQALDGQDSHTHQRIADDTANLVRFNSDLRRRLSEQKLAEEQLRLLATVVENAVDGIMILTPAIEEEGPRIAFVNETFSRITGFSKEHALAETLGIFRFAGGPDGLHRTLLEHFFDEKPFKGEGPGARRDGTECDYEVSTIPVRDEAGGVSHWIAFVRDVSDRKATFLALERQAQYDSLTDVPNRVLLFDRLEQAVLSQRRRKSNVVLMMFDLDRFKEVNDSFGHQTGDILLRQIAYRLRSAARKSDTVARIGGDEFAVMLPQVSSRDSALAVARKLVRALDAPFLLGQSSVSIGASVGIALCPESAADASSLLRCADIAMYRAKQSGGGIVVYSQEHETNTAERLALETHFRSAIDDSQLVLHFQPIVELATKRVVAAEALVRWNHPTEGLIAPDRFIPIAERSGLMRALTQWVLDRTLRQSREWLAEGIDLRFSVNLSPSTLQDASVTETISELLGRRGVKPGALTIEITENSIMVDPGKALALLSLLQTLGVSLSLDDFGTGYSSLANLRQIPFDEIKIDKSFVLEMLNREDDATIVRATIDLAHNLGRKVVAEGVEDHETWRTLASWGCDYGQGYHIARPMAADDFVVWYRRQSSVRVGGR